MTPAQSVLAKYAACAVLFGMLFALVVLKYIDSGILVTMIIAAFTALGINVSPAVSKIVSPAPQPPAQQQ